MYKGVKKYVKTTIDLIKFRCFSWIVASYSIPWDLELLWNVNPVGVIMLHRNNGLQENLKWF